MRIEIANTEQQTLLFTILLLISLILTLKPKYKTSFFDPQLTDEIKGFAILTILLGHIGLFLTTDNQFLHPLSALSGVGVNLFLFLSGLGLTLSHIKSPLNPFEFYKKRLQKLFLPMWVTLIIFLILDFVLLSRTYPSQEIVNGFIGYFPRADLQLNINSPLWYFSLILFYYLIFPILGLLRFPILISLGTFLAGYWFLQTNLLEIDPDVIKLYKLHYWAFPLGVLFAWATSTHYFDRFKSLIKSNAAKIPILKKSIRFLTVFILFFTTWYLTINSGVGETLFREQLLSVLTMFIIVTIFLLKKIKVGAFETFGIVSYEIYLLHWPILSRFDIFYQYLPAYLATFIYLFIFLGLGYLLQRIVSIKNN